MSKARKYYWYVYVYNNAGGGKTYSEGTCWIHPFEEMDRLRMRTRKAGFRSTESLINWKEITVKEHDLFHTNWPTIDSKTQEYKQI